MQPKMNENMMALHCLWCPFCSTKKKQVKLSPRVLFNINTRDFSSFTGYAKKIHTIKLKRENFEQTWLSRATFLIRKLLLIRKLTYLSRIASIWTFLPTVVSLFFFTTVMRLDTILLQFIVPLILTSCFCKCH